MHSFPGCCELSKRNIRARATWRSELRGKINFWARHRNQGVYAASKSALSVREFSPFRLRCGRRRNPRVPQGKADVCGARRLCPGLERCARRARHCAGRSCPALGTEFCRMGCVFLGNSPARRHRRADGPNRISRFCRAGHSRCECEADRSGWPTCRPSPCTSFSRHQRSQRCFAIGAARSEDASCPG